MESLVDELTRMPLDRPYTASDGHTYNEDSLERLRPPWRSPMTREVLRPYAFPTHALCPEGVSLDVKRLYRHMDRPWRLLVRVDVSQISEPNLFNALYNLGIPSPFFLYVDLQEGAVHSYDCASIFLPLARQLAEVVCPGVRHPERLLTCPLVTADDRGMPLPLTPGSCTLEERMMEFCGVRYR